MTETKPMPSEIERAEKLVLTPRESQNAMIAAIAQALADAREQERERCIGRLNNLIGPGIRDAIEAIRRGEP